MPSLTYSVVLITKDRKARAERMLVQVLAQTALPERMVIVDASQPPADFDAALVARAAELGVDLRVLHRPPSMPAQRNFGVRQVETPVTLVLDDDIVLPPEYMQVLLERWAANGFETIGAAVGAARPGPGDNFNRGAAERAIRRLFFVHHTVQDADRTQLRRSGKMWKVPMPAEDVRVPVFANGAIAFRTDLLRKHRFDERFEGYVYGEDLDLTGRLARDAPILHTPATWYIHDQEPSGRPNDQMWYRRSRQEAFYRLRLIDRSPLTLGAFTLSVLAETALAAGASARSRSLGPVRGYLRGLRETLQDAATDDGRPKG